MSTDGACVGFVAPVMLVDGDRVWPTDANGADVVLLGRVGDVNSEGEGPSAVSSTEEGLHEMEGCNDRVGLSVGRLVHADSRPLGAGARPTSSSERQNASYWGHSALFLSLFCWQFVMT